VTYSVVQWATGAIGKTCLRASWTVPSSNSSASTSRGAKEDRGATRDHCPLPRDGRAGHPQHQRILALDADVVIHTARLQVPYETHDPTSSPCCARART